MAEIDNTDSATDGLSAALSQEDALAFKHIQELANIQLEIQALRNGMPALISPLVRPSSQAGQAASAKVDAKAQEAQLEFSQRAAQLQQDVQALVKNLEKICDTLEAAEHIRVADNGQLGESQLTAELQRTETLREVPELMADTIVLAPPIESGDFLFNGKDDIQGPGQMENIDNETLFEDFGLEAYAVTS